MPTTLIVEDEPTIMTLAAALIHDMGHQTLTAQCN
jgi:CheY-like chemotaxis protein